MYQCLLESGILSKLNNLSNYNDRLKFIEKFPSTLDKSAATISKCVDECVKIHEKLWLRDQTEMNECYISGDYENAIRLSQKNDNTYSDLNHEFQELLNLAYKPLGDSNIESLAKIKKIKHILFVLDKGYYGANALKIVKDDPEAVKLLEDAKSEYLSMYKQENDKFVSDLESGKLGEVGNILFEMLESYRPYEDGFDILEQDEGNWYNKLYRFYQKFDELARVRNSLQQ